MIDWLEVAYGIFNQELSCPFFWVAIGAGRFYRRRLMVRYLLQLSNDTSLARTRHSEQLYVSVFRAAFTAVVHWQTSAVARAGRSIQTVWAVAIVSTRTDPSGMYQVCPCGRCKVPRLQVVVDSSLVGRPHTQPNKDDGPRHQLGDKQLVADMISQDHFAPRRRGCFLLHLLLFDQPAW